MNIPGYDRSALILILSSVGLFLGFAIFTVCPEIQYGTFEWTTAQFLNGVRNYLEHGPAALSFKASLMGGANPEANSYGNMPVYHMILSYLLVKWNILQANYLSLQSVTILLFAILTGFLAKYVFDKTQNLKVTLLFALAILVNTGISYSYKDLWWEPYTLFFSFVPLLFLLSRPNARLIPALLGAVQFLAVFDAILFVAVGYLALSWRADRKIHRCAYYYAAGSILGVGALMLFRAYTGSVNVSGGLLLENMIEIDKSDLIRFVYYYFVDAQSFLVWIFAFITYLMTRELYVAVALVAASFAWQIVFPAHALHHAYHYSTVTAIGLLLYIFTANYKNRKWKYMVGISYVLISASISIVLERSRDDVEYSAYRDVSNYVQDTSIVGINIWSYPFSYYADRQFRYIAPGSIELTTDAILVVSDFRQAEKGLRVVYSRIAAMAGIFGFTVPNVIADAYEGRELQFKRHTNELIDTLATRGYQPVWSNPALQAVLFRK